MLALFGISLLLLTVTLGIMITFLVYPCSIFITTYLQNSRTVQVSPPVDPFWYQHGADIVYAVNDNYDKSFMWVDCNNLKTTKKRYNGSINTTGNLLALKQFASVRDGTVLNISIQIHGSSKPDSEAFFYIVTDEMSPPHPSSFHNRFPINTADGMWTNFTVTYDTYGVFFYILELPKGLNSVLDYSIDYVQLNSSGYNFTCSGTDEVGEINCPLKHEGLPGRKKLCLIANASTMSSEQVDKIKANFIVKHTNWIFGVSVSLATIFLLLCIAPPIYYPFHKHIKPCMPWAR